MSLVTMITLILSLRMWYRTRHELVLENALLHYQIMVLKRKQRRINFKWWDRPVLVWLSNLIAGWKKLTLIVRPETLIRWHRKGFSLYWGWRYSSKAGGRRALDTKIIELIKEISRANPLWGAPRVHGELLKLGVKVSQATVEKYMVRKKGPPS